MGDAEADTVGNPGRMVLSSLAISRFATMPPGFLTGLLLLDIGNSFGLAVGVTGQIRTAASIVGVLSALLIERNPPIPPPIKPTLPYCLRLS